MIYVTGDTHGYISRFMLKAPDFIHDLTWTEDDVLIICGDFGFIFHDDLNEELYLDFLEKKKYTICFVDGNHERFPKIFEFPEVVWNGGRTHRIRRNIYHLMRGQVFEIQGKRIFTFGGAFSTDRAFKGDLWWDEEIPSIEEFDEGRKNLARYNYEIDYCISHTAPTFIVRQFGYDPTVNDDRWLVDYLYEDVYKKCGNNLTCWFFGHFHEDLVMWGGMFRALLNDVVKIE